MGIKATDFQAAYERARTFDPPLRIGEIVLVGEGYWRDLGHETPAQTYRRVGPPAPRSKGYVAKRRCRWIWP